MRVVAGNVAKRFVGDGDHTVSIFAGRFRYQLFDPGAERGNRWRGDDGKLIAPADGKNTDRQAERNAGILRWRYLGAASPRHDGGRFEKGAHVVTGRRERYQAEFGKHGIASADTGNAKENATEAFFLGGLLQSRAWIGDGDEVPAGRAAHGGGRAGKKIIH